MKVDEVVKHAISRAGVIRVQNAMNPTLWACSIIPAVSWLAAYFLQSTPMFMPLGVLGMAPVVMLLIQTTYFTIRDPGRLQSEEYQLRHQAMSMIEKKGEGVIKDSEKLLELSESQFEEIENRENNGD